ncbi:sulfatase-like hydrolase/transferase [Blastopirellula sp. JC732]|uniref:Sulfatase-like hydrolase/transferase n=1 Tax=Blastopirellula sediminis TaxID=2894196 RepID=A0A9X1MHT8_9BACT|nr:sulfatase-like hydrolase/transferase [Blastopirellula sediminis]MCC9604301.1 sulfatase-like hydrolase/transferase [Blastopirellula sediminis]MCC9626821.1 sulfatase-like hydrolase/transferase [Blastopirellula sediminis]
MTRNLLSLASLLSLTIILSTAAAVDIDSLRVPASPIADALQYVGPAIREENYTIWGAAPVIDDEGKTHLFAARWPEGNVDPAWRKSSEIAHYVADSPAGPFQFKDVVVAGSGVAGAWDRYAPHNPEVKRFGDKYVLVYIANSDYRQPPHPLNQKIGMMVASSPDGPWRKVGKDGLILDNAPDHFSAGRQVVNPAIVQVGDKYHLYYKTSTRQNGKTQTYFGLAIADQLEGPYRHQPEPVTADGVVIEDASVFTWDGKVCLLTTDNHGDVTGLEGGLALWVSEDGIRFRPDWIQLGMRLFSDYLPDFDQKPLRRIYGNRPKAERPKVLTIDGRPAYLYVASGFTYDGTSRCMNHAFKINLPPDVGPTPEVSAAVSTNAKRPNIVFFLVDDMGWQDTSLPFHTETTALNRQYRTPNMERLAADGMKFTQAYACAICSPTRISWMTGMNAARHGVTCWTLRKDVSPSGKHPNLQEPTWNLNGLSPVAGIPNTVQATTLPSLLQKSGYKTIHIGKAHFGAKGTPGEDPKNLGFDVNIAGHAAGGPGSYHGKHNFSAAWRNADRIWDVPGLEAYHGQDIFLTEALTIEANKEIDKAVAANQPFFLYMAHYAVHAPWENDDRYVENYQDAELPGLGKTLATMLEGMDKSLGDILANLRRHGVEDDTIIVFMSDNGAPQNVPRNLPLRGHKISPYEGGDRVPLIVKWPGVTQAGSTTSDYVLIDDIFPTFLELAQIDGEHPSDGVSFVPQLKQAETIPGRGRPLFWHYPNLYNQPPFSSVRQGDWKLIYHHASQKFELFQLADDIGEKTNLAEKMPDKTRALAQVLSDYLRSVDAAMPIVKATGKPVPWPDEAL